MGFDNSGKEGKAETYLHVSRERGYMFVYAGCAMVCFGLLMKLLGGRKPMTREEKDNA
jgi:hypothetical protein